MRFIHIIIALIVPRCAHSFAVCFRSPVVGAVHSSLQPSSTRPTSAAAEASMTLTGGNHLNRALGTVLVGGALLTGVVGGADVARADVSISPRCITGEGAQCEDLAEGNDLIKALQARSALSKDRYFAETLDTYNQHNFKDYFRAESKHMVKHKNGKYEILTNAEYTSAERAGKVKNDMFLGED